MYLKLYRNFNKRQNSTKRPDDSKLLLTLSDGEFTFKENTDIWHPTFKIYINRKYTNIDPDYAVLGLYNDSVYYYTIESIIPLSSEGVIEMAFKIDPLATFKTNITSSKHMIARQTHDYDSTNTANDDINVLGVSGITNEETKETAWLPTVTITNACYVVKFAGKSGVITMLCSQKAIVNFFKKLMDNPYAAWDGQGDTSLVNFDKTVVDVSSFIYSVKMLPFAYLGAPGETESYQYVGWTNFQIYGKVLSGSSISSTSTDLCNMKKYFYSPSVNWPMPSNTSNMPRSWFQNEKYFKYVIDFEGYGKIEAPGDEILTTAQSVGTEGIPYEGGYLYPYLNVELYVDYASGETTLVITTLKNTYSFSRNLAVEVPIASTATLGAKIATQASSYMSDKSIIGRLSTGTNLASGFDAISVIGSSLSSLLSGNTTTVSTQGGTEGVLIPRWSKIKVTYNFPKFEYSQINDVVGRPIYQYTNIVSGYNKLLDTNVELTAPDYIKNELYGQLLNGFYYE